MNQGITNYNVGDPFEGFMLIKEATKGVASNGKPFLTLIFRDQSGEIDAKFWDASKEDEERFTAEEIVKISGDINQFRGKSQFRISSIRLSDPSDGVHISDFIEKAPVDKEVLMEKLTETIFEMENPIMQRIVRTFIKNHQEDLLIYPAASRNHHEYASGLAHHIVSMLDLARELCKLYPQLNKDLLYAGVFLHDLGMLKELFVVFTTYILLVGYIIC